MITKFGHFKGLKKFVLDNDTNIIHKIINLKDNCNLSKNIKYLTGLQSNNYQIYNYKFKQCPHCNKK